MTERERALTADARVIKAEARLRVLLYASTITIVALLVACLVLSINASSSAKKAAQDARAETKTTARLEKQAEGNSALSAARYQRLLDLLFPPAGSVTLTPQKTDTSRRQVTLPSPAPSHAPAPVPAPARSTPAPAPKPTKPPAPTPKPPSSVCLLGVCL